MDMGSVRHEEEIVRVLHESGIRAFVGKAMMDLNEVSPASEGTDRRSAPLGTRTGGALAWVVGGENHVCRRSPLHSLVHRPAAAGSVRHDGGPSRGCSSTRTRRKTGRSWQPCGNGAGWTISHTSTRLGILRENTCLAHCIWLQNDELGLLAERKSAVLHCPSSNLKLGSGIARIPEMLKRGITVSLGADGAPCNNRLDMFEEMRLAALIQKPVAGPGAMTAAEVLRLATNGGARALGLGVGNRQHRKGEEGRPPAP